MYALEHYEEIDDIHRKQQKKKLFTFVASLSLAVLCAGVSLWGYISAEKRKSENYELLLKAAETTQDYYNAILTDPTRTEAYLQLNKFVADDFLLTKEEGQELLKLRIGLDQKNNSGYSNSVQVLEELQSNDPDGYKEVCYEIGQSFLFYYDVNIDRDRYSNAAKWFDQAKDTYSIAEIYCDIASCLELINQYNGSKIKQTEKMYEEYGKLWSMIGRLKEKADDFDSVDSKIQVWNEINGMVNANIAPFLEVTDGETLSSLLLAIADEAATVNKSILQEDIAQLQAALNATVEKIATANA
jgi:serine/threonine-protein kinase